MPALVLSLELARSSSGWFEKDVANDSWKATCAESNTSEGREWGVGWLLNLRFWGAPIFSSEAPKPLSLRILERFGAKIWGAPNADPTTTQRPILGPLNTESLTQTPKRVKRVWRQKRLRKALTPTPSFLGLESLYNS